MTRFSSALVVILALVVGCQNMQKAYNGPTEFDFVNNYETGISVKAVYVGFEKKGKDKYKVITIGKLESSKENPAVVHNPVGIFIKLTVRTQKPNSYFSVKKVAIVHKADGKTEKFEETVFAGRNGKGNVMEWNLQMPINFCDPVEIYAEVESGHENPLTQTPSYFYRVKNSV
jgi:hypothetical protein